MNADRDDRVQRPRTGRDRPHLFPGRPRAVNARFTDDEYAELAAAASRFGLTPTGFCAHAALAAARDTGERMEHEALANLQAELMRVRVTINQTRADLGRNVDNSGSRSHAHAVLDIAIAKIAESFASLDDLISRIDRRLSRKA